MESASILDNPPRARARTAWRAERLHRLGVPHLHAEVSADLVDWQAVANLVARGCPATLAVKIIGLVVASPATSAPSPTPPPARPGV
jgi:hypothetical protein